MFWGISLEAGKRYSQTVEKSFHISMAALNPSHGEKHSVTVMVEVEKACYPLCTLNPDRIPQQALDYVFTEGEEVLFYTEGNLDVHLTGYLIDDPNPVEYSSDEEVESGAESNASSSDEEKQTNKEDKPTEESSNSEDDNLQSLISELDDLNQDNEGSVNLILPRSARKRQKSRDLEEEIGADVSLTEKLLFADGSEESEEDNEWQPGKRKKLLKKKKVKIDVPEENTKKGNKLIDSSNNCMNSKNNTTELDDSLSKQILSPSKPKKKGGLKEKDAKASNGLAENVECGDDIDEKNCSQQEKSLSTEDKNKMDLQNTEEKLNHASRKILPGEIIIEDLVKGQGKKAKRGKQVSLYYKGNLKKTKKQFDSCLSGKPFTFRLGDGEVIKGWDVGVEGMQVGGKRRLTIPPSHSQGYGSKGHGQEIPPNSTLVFVVELMKVH